MFPSLEIPFIPTEPGHYTIITQITDDEHTTTGAPIRVARDHLAARCTLAGGEVKGHRRPDIDNAFGAQRTAVRTHDAERRREPKATRFRFRRKERVENVRQQFSVDAAAAVTDFDKHKLSGHRV